MVAFHKTGPQKVGTTQLRTPEVRKGLNWDDSLVFQEVLPCGDARPGVDRKTINHTQFHKSSFQTPPRLATSTGVIPSVFPDMLAQHSAEARFITPHSTEPDYHETTATTLQNAFAIVHRTIALHWNFI